METNYKEGTLMTQFEHIESISKYNHNYYKGFGNDLLYGESDDDYTTEWYLVNKQGLLDFKHIGRSFHDDQLVTV